MTRQFLQAAGIAVLMSAGSPTASLAGQEEVADLEVAACAKPVVSLVVKETDMSLGVRGGTASFAVYAIAGGGFQGAVSGTITVSEPVNEQRIRLHSGEKPQTFPFTLAAGGATPSSCNGEKKYCFVIATAADNTNAGTLFYTVFLDPSAQYAGGEGLTLHQMRVTVK